MHSHHGPSLFTLVHFARHNRKFPTRSEALLWAHVRGRQLGPRVRRQHPLHPFIVDFYVPSYKLVIEIDGSVHDPHEALDAARAAELVRLYGVRILRIEARLVERDVRAAVAMIRATLV